MENVKYVLFSLLIAIPSLTSATTYTTQASTKLTPVIEAPKATTPSTSFTGSFDVTSNYIFRGISQTSNLPAFQGGLTYTFLKPGIYLNIWGSNVNFKDTYGNTATLEMDTDIGITNTIGDNFTYDFRLVRYNYPKTASGYGEFVTNLTYYFLTAQIAYSSNVYNTHHVGTYYNLSAKYTIPSQYIFKLENIAVSGGVGHYSLPSSAGLRSYDDYNVQISKTISNYVLALQWTDTNRRSVDATSLKSNHILGTVTVNF